MITKYDRILNQLRESDTEDVLSSTAFSDLRTFQIFIPTPTDASDYPVFRFDKAGTLNKVVYSISGGTNVVCQLQEATDARGTGKADTQAADSTVIATTAVTTFSNASFDAGDFAVLKVASVTGEVAWIHIQGYYSIN